MARRSYGHVSATMPGGITLERSRADLNAFLVVCFVWPTMPKPARVVEPVKKVAA